MDAIIYVLAAWAGIVAGVWTMVLVLGLLSRRGYKILHGWWRKELSEVAREIITDMGYEDRNEKEA